MSLDGPVVAGPTSTNDGSDSSDSDEFEEAQSTFTEEPDPDKSVTDAMGLKALETAMDLLNRNKFHKALGFLKPQAGSSMYHAIGYGSIIFLQAVFSMEPDNIEQATTVVTEAVALCNLQRKSKGVMESISGWIFGQRLDNYTMGELQAEILYAEGNLLLSMLTFLGDESLISFIKGGLRIRNCYTLYKQLFQWLVVCEQEGVEVEPNFATGVRMGIGCFNLFLSLLPGRILKLLEFIGFSSNLELGLAELNKGAASGSFLSPMCTTFLLFYYSMAAVFIGIGEMDADHAESLLRPQIEKYPDSVQFLYFKGRVELMRGSVNEAIVCFEHARDVQDEWPQAHHLFSWELMWCHCFKGEWITAASLAEELYRHTKWSKATFLYQKACFQLMMRGSGGLLPSEVTPGVSKEEMEDLMRQIPSLKQRIAGKSLPIEKFAVAKSERYLQGGRLPLCGMEVLYAWNAFVLLAKNPPLLHNMLRYTWSELLTVEDDGRDNNPFYTDDWCVVMLLQGVCFKFLKRFEEAERCFQGVIDRSQEVQHDHYVVAAATMELGLLYIMMEKIDEAERQLDIAKTKYTGYHLESRIHFRIHSGQRKISQLKEAASS